MSQSSSTSPTPLFPPLPTSPSTTLTKRIRRWRQTSLPAPPIDRFTHYYYLVQYAALFGYFPIREFIWPLIQPGIKPFEASSESKVKWIEWTVIHQSLIEIVAHFLLSLSLLLARTHFQEAQMFLILAVILFTKYRRSNTMETFLNNYVIKYAKLAIIFAAYMVDVWLCVFEVVLFGIVLLIGPKEPQYHGPTNVKEIGLDYFKQSIDTPKADPNITYIVNLYSVEADTCTWFDSEFARTSLHYGYDGSSILFCSISLDAFPALIDKFQLLTPKMNRFEHELPTVIMFQGGTVKARLPEIGRKTMLNEANLIRAMDLENQARIDPKILEELIQKDEKKKPTQEAKKTK